MWFLVCARRAIEAMKVVDKCEDSFETPKSTLPTMAFGMGYREVGENGADVENVGHSSLVAATSVSRGNSMGSDRSFRFTGSLYDVVHEYKSFHHSSHLP